MKPVVVGLFVVPFGFHVFTLPATSKFSGNGPVASLSCTAVSKDIFLLFVVHTACCITVGVVAVGPFVKDPPTTLLIKHAWPLSGIIPGLFDSLSVLF